MVEEKRHGERTVQMRFDGGREGPGGVEVQTQETEFEVRTKGTRHRRVGSQSQLRLKKKVFSDTRDRRDPHQTPGRRRVAVMDPRAIVKP